MCKTCGEAPASGISTGSIRPRGYRVVHVLENQYNDLSQKYIEAQMHYNELLNASKEADNKEEDRAQGDGSEDMNEEEMPPLEEETADASGNSKFEDTGEIEFEMIAEGPDTQKDADCERLRAEFNAASTLEAQRRILQQATDCSWFGRGLAALAIQENNQGSRELQSEGNLQQQVRTGAMGVIIPNPFPNPYVRPPKPWKRRQGSDLTHFDPNRIQKTPPKPVEPQPVKKPSPKPTKKDPSKKPNYPSGGSAFGY